MIANGTDPEASNRMNGLNRVEGATAPGIGGIYSRSW